jgi:hypothetical protein
MKILPNLFVLLGFSMAAVAQEPAGEVTALLEELCDVNTSHDRLLACERRLCELPAGEVLPRIESHPGRRMPSGAIWNSRGPEGDRDAPHPWRVWNALGRTEGHLRRHAPVDELRRARATQLGVDPSDHSITIWLFGLHRIEAKAVLPAARAVFSDAARDLELRVEAASVLLNIDAQKSYAAVSAFAIQNNRIAPLFDKLARPYSPPIAPDPRVVVWAFAWLEEECRAHPAYVAPAYFAARRIERLVGQSFYPGAGGLLGGDNTDLKNRLRALNESREERLQATVDRARAWWKENRSKYER